MRRWEAAAVVLLVMVGATCFYRAATQAITCDEALTWRLILGRPDANPFIEGRANNHVLFTLLAWVSTRLFAVSELTLRLPTVLAAVLYLSLCHRICRRACASASLAFLGFCLLALNPYVLDYLVAARGYGIALALSLSGLSELFAWTSDGRDSRLLRAGLGLGLAVAAHLTFAILAVAVGLAFLVPEAVAAAPRGACAVLMKSACLVALLVGPALLVAGALLAPMLLQTPFHAYYGGVGTLLESVHVLARKCLAHPDDHFRSAADSWFAEPAVLNLVAVLVVCLWIASASFVCLNLARRRKRRAATDSAERLLLLSGGAFAWTAPVLLLAVVVGPPLGFAFAYPDARRALWILPLVSLAAIALTDRLLRSSGPAKTLGRLGAALLTVVVLRFAAQWNTAFLSDCYFDAGSRRIFDVIEAHRQTMDVHAVRIGVQLSANEPALSFYREVRGATDMTPVGRILEEDLEPFDYVVLRSDLASERFRGLGLGELLYRDPVSGVWVAYLP